MTGTREEAERFGLDEYDRRVARASDAGRGRRAPSGAVSHTLREVITGAELSDMAAQLPREYAADGGAGWTTLIDPLR